MRALFVGGVVDNSEMDLEGSHPPVHYPEDTGGGHSRYRLHQVGHGADGSVAYAVYGAPELADDEVARVAEERAYARRFEATPTLFEH
ncbi:MULTISPECIES: hypothetical protein [Stenotrophomonas]|jgi:hypothetical protein|uniref:hypothetical protein n=1 Tax=Stenotrophomonas TaxID=40323 RepID=UPI00201D0DD1|nr:MULTISPECIES: hypothetical protein [Stenotrophomonas]MBN5027781.1 hypothetical protein [Stenotrophomonas maltophilia]MDH1275437.1 hypothetical protein [Stenotrophomonas sp. GD03937]MDH1485775.1 hypothetical protein [Stenotrophomonas sp. GD03712]UQY94117.1 hypothetical protein LZ605_13270 [Stenotrophomonas maltophilia]WON69206.1 hypothetical protein RWT08_02320 [Stenotrophomonas maltophilia]